MLLISLINDIISYVNEYYIKKGLSKADSSKLKHVLVYFHTIFGTKKIRYSPNKKVVP